MINAPLPGSNTESSGLNYIVELLPESGKGISVRSKRSASILGNVLFGEKDRVARRHLIDRLKQCDELATESVRFDLDKQMMGFNENVSRWMQNYYTVLGQFIVNSTLAAIGFTVMADNVKHLLGLRNALMTHTKIYPVSIVLGVEKLRPKDKRYIKKIQQYLTRELLLCKSNKDLDIGCFVKSTQLDQMRFHVYPHARSAVLQSLYLNPVVPTGMTTLQNFLRVNLNIMNIDRAHVVSFVRAQMQSQLQFPVYRRKRVKNMRRFNRFRHIEVDLIDLTQNESVRVNHWGLRSDMHTAILTCVHSDSRLCAARFIRDKRASTVTEAMQSIFEEWFTEHNIVPGVHITIIKSDKGKEFNFLSDNFRSKMKYVPSQVHNHGMIEVFNRVISRVFFKKHVINRGPFQDIKAEMRLNYRTKATDALRQVCDLLNTMPRALFAHEYGPTFAHHNSGSIWLHLIGRDVSNACNALPDIKQKLSHLTRNKWMYEDRLASLEKAYEQRRKERNEKKTMKDGAKSSDTKRQRMFRNIPTGSYVRILVDDSSGGLNTMGMSNYEVREKSWRLTSKENALTVKRSGASYKGYRSHWSYDIYVVVFIRKPISFETEESAYGNINLYVLCPIKDYMQWIDANKNILSNRNIKDVLQNWRNYRTISSTMPWIEVLQSRFPDMEKDSNFMYRFRDEIHEVPKNTNQNIVLAPMRMFYSVQQQEQASEEELKSLKKFNLTDKYKPVFINHTPWQWGPPNKDQGISFPSITSVTPVSKILYVSDFMQWRRYTPKEKRQNQIQQLASDCLKHRDSCRKLLQWLSPNDMETIPAPKTIEVIEGSATNNRPMRSSMSNLNRALRQSRQQRREVDFKLNQVLSEAYRKEFKSLSDTMKATIIVSRLLNSDISNEKTLIDFLSREKNWDTSEKFQRSVFYNPSVSMYIFDALHTHHKDKSVQVAYDKLQDLLYKNNRQKKSEAIKEMVNNIRKSKVNQPYQFFVILAVKLSLLSSKLAETTNTKLNRFEYPNPYNNFNLGQDF